MPQPDEAMHVLEEKALQLDVGTFFHEAVVFPMDFDLKSMTHDMAL